MIFIIKEIKKKIKYKYAEKIKKENKIYFIKISKRG
jgi:hypothetical protein